MRSWKIASSLFVLAAAGLICARTARAQEVPKPGPEHELLKKYVGVWDATIEMTEPGGQTQTSKGTETCRMLSGGLWLVTQFKGELMGQTFEGNGATGYDPGKKKYVESWVDSMSTGIAVGDSTYDPATKTVTGTLESPDPSGKPMKMKAVTQWKDDTTRVFTMSFTGPDGKDMPALKISYKKRGGRVE